MKNTITLGKFYIGIGQQAEGSPILDRAVCAACVTETGMKKLGEGWLLRLPFTGNRQTVGVIFGKWQP